MNEDNIKEAAKKYAESTPLRNREYGLTHSAFTSGALSPEAKEYWQQGMYTKQEVKDLFDLFIDTNTLPLRSSEIDKWFENNTKK